MGIDETSLDILDNDLSGIIVFNDEGIVTYLNESAKKDLECESTGMNINKLFTVLMGDITDVKYFMGTVINQIIDTIIYRDNATFYQCRVKFVRFINGDKPYNIAYIINIQEEKDARREFIAAEVSMKESMKTRNEFVANVTHELRTPVNGIKGHINNLIAEESDEKKKYTMDIIYKCCCNMEKIINNMLDFSKIEAGKFDIEEAEFDIRKCVEHVIDTSISVANEKGIRLTAVVADNIPETIIGDELRVTQILNNLVSNALKFTHIGHVSVEVYMTSYDGNIIELTFIVADTGIGIGIEEKERIFESFSQADGSITRKYGGTGLGLYVTKQLVELMHGHIGLESEKGKGSTFTFTIEVKSDCPDIEDNIETQIELFNSNVDEDEVDINNVYIYGSDDNISEIKSNIEKLVLCIEMGNWEKAEMFTDNIKQLCDGGEETVKKRVFRMQMSVRKADYNKSIDNLDKFKEELNFA